MVQKCSVANCISYVQGRAARVSLFSSPKDVERRKKWIDVVRDAWLKMYPGEEFKLNENFFVCELHFRQTDLIRKWIATDKDGKVIHETLYKKPRLVDGAVPMGDLFEEKMLDVELEVDQFPIHNSVEDAADFIIDKIASKSATIESNPKRKISIFLDQENSRRPINQESLVCEFPKPVLPAMKKCSKSSEGNLSTVMIPGSTNGTNLFEKLLHDNDNLKLPPRWNYTLSFGVETCIVFSQLMMIEEINFNTPSATIPTIVKQVFFGSDLKLKSAVLSMKVDLNELLGYDTVCAMDELLEVIKKIDAMRFCRGAGNTGELSTESTKAFIDARGKWRSKKCLKLLPASSKIYCDECTHFRNLTLRNMRLRKKNGSLKNGIQTSESSRTLYLLNKLRDRIKNEQRSKNRQKARVRLLTEKMGKIQNAMKKVNAKDREEELITDEYNSSE